MIHLGRIVHTFYPDAIGDPFSTYELSLRQSRTHKVSVFTWKRVKRSSLEYVNTNFKITRLQGLNLALKPFFTGYPLLPALGEAIKAEKSDIIHAHSHLFLTTYSAVKTARKLRIPSIVTVHGVMAERDLLTNLLQYAYLYSLSSQIFNTSTLVICLTKNDAKQVLRFGCSPEKIRIIPNPVDTNLFKPNPAVEEENLVVWVGRFVPEKGLAYLTRAAKIVVGIDRHVKFMVVGGGQLKSKLADLIKYLHLENNIFIINPLERKEIAEILARSSVFAFPSLKEGFPKAVLEAMSVGKPIVASDIAGLNEVIENNVNGVLVSPRNPGALANAILRLLGDEQLRKKLGGNARKTVIERFTWDKVLQEYGPVYEEAMALIEH